MNAPTAPHKRSASDLMSAANVVVSKTRGLGYALVMLLGAGGGAYVASDDVRVDDLSRRLETHEERVDDLATQVSANDSAAAVAALQARVQAVETSSERQDVLLARLTRAAEVQVQVSRHIGGNLQKIGAKIGAKLDPLPEELASGMNNVMIDSALRRVRGVQP